MLNTFRSLVTPLTLAALALATGACGRISILPPAPPAPPSTMYAPIPAEVATAVASARKALQDPDPTLVYAAAYGVQPSGKMADSHRSGWVVGFNERRAAGPRGALVVIDWTADTTLRVTKPWTGAVPRLDAAKLPPVRQTVLWARDAGLKKADTFMVAYVATAAGPVAAVTPREEDFQAAFDDADGARQVVMLDALTGKPLAKVAAPGSEADALEAPEAAPEAGAEDAEAPADAADLAALVMDPRRGR